MTGVRLQRSGPGWVPIPPEGVLVLDRPAGPTDDQVAGLNCFRSRLFSAHERVLVVVGEMNDPLVLQLPSRLPQGVPE